MPVSDRWNSCSHPKQSHKYFIPLSVCRRLGDAMVLSGSTAVPCPSMHVWLCLWFSPHEPSVPGRSAANKTIYSRQWLVICSSTASALPAPMPAGPGGMCCVLGAGAGSALSFPPCNTVPGKHRTLNVHARTEIKSSGPQMLDAVAWWCAKPGFTAFLTYINLCPYALDCLQLLG